MAAVRLFRGTDGIRATTGHSVPNNDLLLPDARCERSAGFGGALGEEVARLSAGITLDVDDDIRSNLASKAASESPMVHVGAENRLHAMEFLEYAYLQIG